MARRKDKIELVGVEVRHEAPQEPAVVTEPPMGEVAGPDPRIAHLEAENGRLLLVLEQMRAAKNAYKGLAAQGIAEAQYFQKTHGTEYIVRRVGELLREYGAVKDVE